MCNQHDEDSPSCTQNNGLGLGGDDVGTNDSVQHMGNNDNSYHHGQCDTAERCSLTSGDARYLNYAGTFTV
ncbi:hypothetical protein ZHAS_00002982 [Anopheles sinensis]|uniref:Uncharacterized protein n=1 Tax=Anopheles sinensis TaxID=74873 RepID=A0A084VDF9_ANOSI|nr:hypothetical protein ZHAS_00002982 [Anopheles sinensis]